MHLGGLKLIKGNRERDVEVRQDKEREDTRVTWFSLDSLRPWCNSLMAASLLCDKVHDRESPSRVYID